MDIQAIASSSKEFVKRNSPAILTGAGVAGVVGTSVLSFRAGYSVGSKEALDGVAEDPKQRFKEHYKDLILPTSSAALTIAAILGANSTSTKRNAALVSAYSVLDTGFREYKSKIVEKLGEKKEAEVVDEIAKERLASNPGPDATIIVGSGKILCYDSYSGRYFESDHESIRAAQNDINAQCLNNVYASQNDFYSILGLSRIAQGDDVGWNSGHRMDISISTTMTADNKPALAIMYPKMPTPNYYKGHGW